MPVRYLLLPGYVQSVEDGDMHYIDAPTLCKLYKIHPREATTVLNVRQLPKEQLDKLIKLAPSRDGNYTLPGGYCAVCNNKLTKEQRRKGNKCCSISCAAMIRKSKRNLAGPLEEQDPKVRRTRARHRADARIRRKYQTEWLSIYWRELRKVGLE